MKTCITILMAAFVALGPLAAEDADFVPLCNGKDLAGWKQIGGKSGVWKVEDGMIVCLSSGGGWLSTEATFADFELRLDYRLQPGGNSGVFIRAPRRGATHIDGMEIQLLDEDHARYKGIKPYQRTGSIYGVVPPSKHAIKPGGQWNEMVIRAEGRKVTVAVNKEVVVDANLDDHLQAAPQHPGILRKDGYIGLQSHDDRVEFRNPRIRKL